MNEVRFDSFFSLCRSLSLSLSVSVSFQKELEFEKARVFFSQQLSSSPPGWDLFKLGVLVLPRSREEILHYFYIARRRQRRKARSLALAMFCRCAAALRFLPVPRTEHRRKHRLLSFFLFSNFLIFLTFLFASLFSNIRIEIHTNALKIWPKHQHHPRTR